MKNYTWFLAIVLSLFSSAYAIESPVQIKPPIEPQKTHQIYLGPDIFYDHFKEKFSAPDEDERVRSTTVFVGLRICYDYLKPKTFYLGTDALFAIGSNHTKIDTEFDLFYGWGPHPFHKWHQRHQNSPLLANFEQRGGYTFQSSLGKSTLTPFLGIGWYHARPQFDNSTSSTHWFYGAVGLRANQRFYDHFDIGFNVKAMYAFAGRRHASFWSSQNKAGIRNSWGYEVDLPFTWVIGSKWSIQFQPYLLKLDVNNKSQIFGMRLLAGYGF